jgi:hypothetical protein
VQGRDPRQTSDALGAAAVQLGPEALALAVQMNKGLSMPHADVASVLQTGFGLRVNRSTICRAVDRAARRGQATWHALRQAAQQHCVNTMDETGWKVDAQLQWLWVVANDMVTVCDILPGRGFEQAASLLGADYDGFLVRDGWGVYRKFITPSGERVRTPQGTRWLVQSQPDFMKDGPWTTTVIIGDGHGAFLQLVFPNRGNGGVSSEWLNEKLLFLRIWLG